MDNKLLYNNIMKNIKYSLKSILNEDILNFDVTDYSDNDNDLIDNNTINYLSIDITSNADLLKLTESFVNEILSLYTQLGIGLENIMKGEKISSKRINEYISILNPSILIFEEPFNEIYYSGDGHDIDITHYEMVLNRFLNMRSAYINVWYDYILHTLVNNGLYKQFINSAKTNNKQLYSGIKDMISPKYKYTILTVLWNMDELDYEKIDFNGICRLFSAFSKDCKIFGYHLSYDGAFIQIEFDIYKNTSITKVIKNIISLLKEYIDFVISNFEKYVKYKKTFNCDEYDPDTYLTL